jgi:nucleoside-diphosphate-sugar epimerase
MNKKRILITGKGSYVGTSFKKWVEQWPEQYDVEEISVRGEEWQRLDFSVYDVVLHVAGIAHVSTDPSMESQYYKINRDLTVEVASKAKHENVKQFIFLSSIIVYGSVKSSRGLININTIPKPINFYGKSKLQAEEKVAALENESFKVVILRPPMIYGSGSKGNYQLLAKFSIKSPIFPNIINKRSVIHIDNLCEFLRLIIVNKEQGIFFPQNFENVSTSQMVTLIAEVYGKKIILTKIFNPIIINKLTQKVGLINKIFGNLAYELNMSKYKDNYQIRNLKESIQLTETNR